MLFHVTNEHDYLACPARAREPWSDEVRESQKWLEGNEEVKVLGGMWTPAFSQVIRHHRGK